MDISLFLDLIKRHGANEKVGFWMGANDLRREGVYVWLDGYKGKFNYIYQ